MLFPYNTDAPVYYWPFATVGLIVLNTLILAVDCANPGATDPFILHWGTINPIQWVTCNFLHADFFHLLGNMIGLWAFGLIVEGKLGPWKFLAVYLGIGVGQAAAVQFIMLGASSGGALGASGAIFGIMVLALLWAPLNNVSCFLFIFFRPIFFEATVYAYVGFWLCLELLFFALGGGAMSSEALHLMGAAFGLVVGVVMLRTGQVDCENWDLFSCWTGRNKMTAAELAAKDREEETPEQKAKRRESMLLHFRHLVAHGDPDAALATHRRASDAFEDWTLDEADFFGLIAAFDKQMRATDAMPLMIEYVQRHSRREPLIRLKLAQLCLLQQRPAQALKVLAKLTVDALTEQQRKFAAQLQRKAQSLKASGVLEVQTENW